VFFQVTGGQKLKLANWRSVTCRKGGGGRQREKSSPEFR